MLEAMQKRIQLYGSCFLQADILVADGAGDKSINLFVR